MPSCRVSDIREVVDGGRMGSFRRRVPSTVERHGGRYLAIGGPFEGVEGRSAPVFPVVIEFPDLAAARGWHDSKDYRELKAPRVEAVRSSAVFIAGR